MPESSDRKYVEDVPREVQDLLFAGQKIQAIKLLRDQTGAGLKEAKEQADKLDALLRQMNPSQMPAQAKGCVSVIAVGLLLGAAATWYHLHA